MDKQLNENIYPVAKELGCEILELEGMPDPVHILCEVDPQFGVHKFVMRVKGRSSRVLRQEFSHLKSRLPALWTHAYFVSVVGGAPIAILKRYIENQQSV